MSEIVIIGAGGFGREVLDVVEAINSSEDTRSWHVVGVLDDDPSQEQLSRLSARGYHHLGGVDGAATVPFAHFIVAIGNPQVRSRVVERLSAFQAKYATLVHPRANIGSMADFAEGTVVCSGAQISTNVRLGKHVHVNPGGIVGHDAVIEDIASVNPGAVISGETRIGARSLVGAGSVILQGLTVQADAVIGAGACVTKDVSGGAIVKGVPAR